MEPTPSRQEQFDRWAVELQRYMEAYVAGLFVVNYHTQLQDAIARNSRPPATHPEQAAMTKTQSERARRLIAAALEGDEDMHPDTKRPCQCFACQGFPDNFTTEEVHEAARNLVASEWFNAPDATDQEEPE